MEITILSIIVTVAMLAVYSIAQDRMRRDKDDEIMNLLIEIRTMNSGHMPLDAWLTDKINPIMAEQLKRGFR